jgi:hypothetical protein
MQIPALKELDFCHRQRNCGVSIRDLRTTQKTTAVKVTQLLPHAQVHEPADVYGRYPQGFQPQVLCMLHET